MDHIGQRKANLVLYRHLGLYVSCKVKTASIQFQKEGNEILEPVLTGMSKFSHDAIKEANWKHIEPGYSNKHSNKDAINVERTKQKLQFSEELPILNQ